MLDSRRLALLALFALACPAGVAAEPSARSAEIHRVEAPPPVLDGVLDDAAWSQATLLEGLRQVNPDEGEPATQRTQIHVFYDADFLYLGVRCFDDEPDRLIAKQLRRDVSMTSDDRINLIFDTFHDQRNAYFFQINPIGARSEALIENNQSFRREWDGIWHGVARIDEQGWTAEVAIPFKTVSFDGESRVWGFEFERIIRRNNETARWGNPGRNRRVTTISGLATLHGFEDLEGVAIDVKPSQSVTYSRDRVEDRTNLIGQPSLDVFYKFTDAVTASLTFNTDFSDAPVDVRQTNLTRFALFFPETRDFFLRDQAIFQFGGLSGNNLPFFSRRIGFAGGEVVDLDVGLKATGRIGRTSFGLLSVQTGAKGDVRAQHLSVVRVQTNVLEESAVGVIFTEGDPEGETNNALIGADYNYRNSYVFGDQIFNANFWVQRTFSSGTSGREMAFGARLEYPNDRISWTLGFTEVQENYNPELGRSNRRGIRRTDDSFRYRWRPDNYLRTVDTGFFGSVVLDRDHHLESGVFSGDIVELTNQDGDSLRFRYIFTDERPDAPFRIGDDTVIAAGDYTWDRGNVRLRTASSRAVQFSIDVSFGEFYDGHLTRTNASIQLRPSSYVFVSLSYQQNDGRGSDRTNLTPEEMDLLDGGTVSKGDFTQRLAIGRVDFAFTPQVSWSNLIQYDNSSDTISLNSRLSWEIEDGDDFFFVINQGWDADSHGIAPNSGDITAKLGWTFRF